jgi:hypothetical protein
MSGRVKITLPIGVADYVAEDLRAVAHVTCSGSSVGVEEQLGRIAAYAVGWPEGPRRPIPVCLRGSAEAG